MRRGYDPDYGSRQQLKDCHESGMKLRRELDALKTEKAELLDRLNKIKWDIEQHRTLLVCMRHFMNCNGADECHTCITTADMYIEMMS